MKRKVFSLGLSFLFLFFLVIGNLNAQTPYQMSQYLPMEQGDYWVYSGSEDGENYTEITIINGTETINGIETIRKITYEDYECLAWDGEGLKWYKEGEVDDEGDYMVFDSPVLLFPLQMEVGQQITASVSYSEYENGQFDETGTGSRTLTLVGLEDITVPAGTFTNCLKFIENISWQESDGGYGTIEKTFWLAEGIGEVKSISTETEYNPEEGTETETRVRELTFASIGGVSYGHTTVGIISGHVYQIDRVTPIGGAKVQAIGVSEGAGWGQAITSSDGSYNIILPPGDYKVRVIASGYAREYYDNVTPSHEATIINVTEGSHIGNIDFDLTEGGSISGHVYQSDGITPIAGAEVFVRPSKYFFDEGFCTTTASDGSYVIDGLALGQYKVRAEAPGYAKLRYYDGVYGWRNATNVTVTPPENTPNININLDLAGSISGYVYASDGITPIQVSIIADSTSGGFEGIGAMSNEDGSYTIEGLPPVSYTVRIGEDLPGWYAGEFYNSKYTWSTADHVPVSAGVDTNNINFTLDEGGCITGHVFDEETGEPISGVQLGACLPNGDGVTPAPVTSYDGSYKINLKPGTYYINVFHTHGYIPEWYQDAYNMAYATPVEVEFHKETSGIDFYLARPGLISGHVYEEDGTTPIAGANLYAFPVDSHLIGSGANSKPDGSYTINGLPSGNYVVQAIASGYVMGSRVVTVDSPHETPDIDFALAAYPYSLKIVGLQVIGSGGGTVSVTDTSSEILGAQVEIPADALSENTIIAISELVEEIPPFPEDIIGIGSPVHFGPEGLVFNKPVTIKLPYTEEDLENAGVSDPQELDVYTFNTTTSTWELVEGPKTVDEENMLVMIDVTHFSIFQLGVRKVAIQGDLDNDGDIDQNDLNILLTYRNQPASACPECDIDGDGIITVLDARKLVLMCTRPRCATEPK